MAKTVACLDGQEGPGGTMKLFLRTNRVGAVPIDHTH
jgi:hypothetical protein